MTPVFVVGTTLGGERVNLDFDPPDDVRVRRYHHFITFTSVLLEGL